MQKSNEKNVPETKVASATKIETTEVLGGDGSEIKDGPATSEKAEGQATETIATGVQTGKGSTTIGIAPNATIPTLLGERRATAVKRLALRAGAVAVKDSNAATTGEVVSNAAMTGGTAGLEATTKTIAPEASVSRTEISTRTIGPVLHATTQISRSETPATVARHLARVAVAVGATAEVVVEGTAEATVGVTAVLTNETNAPTTVMVGLSEETTVASDETNAPTEMTVGHSEETTVASDETNAPTEMTVGHSEETTVASDETNAPTEMTVGHSEETTVASDETNAPTEMTVGHSEETTVASDETNAPTEMTVGHSEETTVAVTVASSPGMTGARLRTGPTDAHEENVRATPTINRLVTSGTARHGNLTENETIEAVP